MNQSSEILISSRALLSNVIGSVHLGGGFSGMVAVIEEYSLVSIVSSMNEHK